VADVPVIRPADDEPMDLLVCFDDPDPPQGHVRTIDPVGPRAAFVGWLGLLAALEDALRSDPAGPGDLPEGGDRAR
jgi:hypothetical protein